MTQAALKLSRRLLGIVEAANYLSLTPRTVQKLIARGVLHPVRIPGVRRTLLDCEEIARLVEHGRSRPSLAGEAPNE